MVSPTINPSNQSPKGVKVLVVQDNQELLRELAVMLHTGGFEVLTASDGEEGWAIFVAHNPPAVISAVRMPNLDGVNLLRRIRAKTPDAKVILVTTIVNPDTEQEAHSLGVTAFLPLPIPDPAALLTLIEPTR